MNIKLFQFSFKLLIRDWRAGELRIFMIAIIIAVTALTSTQLYSNRIERALALQSAELLGGDLLVSSPTTIPSTWQTMAKQLKLRSTIQLIYLTVASADNSLQLTNVKAVGNDYPLRGSVQITADNKKIESTTQQPPLGTVWVEQRLLDLLNITVNKILTIGTANFTVSQILVNEPDVGGFPLAPKLLMNMDDVAKTQTVLPGSRVEYRFLIAGDRTAIEAFKNWLKPHLTSAQTVIDLYNNRPELRSTYDRALTFLNLAGMVCIILAGVAIACAAFRYTERHRNHAALLRCFGAIQNSVLVVYFTQLILLSLVSSLIGCCLGYLLQSSLTLLFAPWLKLNLPAPSLFPILTGLLAGVLLLLGFALPRFIQLKNVSPLQVLRNDFPPVKLSLLGLYGAPLLAIAGLIFWTTQNTLLTIILLYGIALTAVGLYGCARLLIFTGSHLRGNTGITWRYGLTSLARRKQSSTLQLAVFGLVIMIIMLQIMLRTDLLSSWEKRIPPKAPNFFAINIQADEVTQLNTLLNQYQITPAGIYPMVRGRLTKLNNQPIKEAVAPNARNHNALNRELNLTWATALPSDNKIVDGHWWNKQDDGNAVVSIEAKLASELHILLGDQLTLQIENQQLTATVISTRTVEWDSFRPNFFLIFPPHVLDKFPATYITSFYVPINNKTVLPNLLKQFPSITLIDTTAILNQVRTMLDKAVIAISYLTAFTLFAAILVMFAILQTTLDERLYEGALLRTLGASRRQLHIALLTEFIFLGFFAGLLGTGGAALTTAFLAEKIFSLTFHPNYNLYLLGILASTLFISLLGFISTYRIIKQPPLSILRQLF